MHLSEDELESLLYTVEGDEGENLTDRERTAAIASLSASLDHYDILSSLISNPDINDIIVRSHDDISVQSGRSNIQTDLRFSDHESYLSFVENLLKRVGKACTLATPVIDAAVDPHIRVCVTHESFSPEGSGPMMTIRVARHKAVSTGMLVASELAPAEMINYLSVIISLGLGTVLVAGEVGTGKTTLVKALSGTIPENEAILIIEDTHELVLTRPFVRTLLTREANTEGAGKIPPAVAIRAGMRMAMNRLILGEMRDAEAAESFIDVCSSGHSGMSTIHSRNARDALVRLELFLSRAQPQVTSASIKQQIANAISVVVHLGIDKREKKRRILEIAELAGAGDGSIQLAPMYRFDQRPTRPSWFRGDGISKFNRELASCSVVLSPPGACLDCDEA
jgi:pilus assembly protein CpaF